MASTTAHRRSQGRTPEAPRRASGQWKLAYADFLTALAIFFLVLWIVEGRSAAERADLAAGFGGVAGAISPADEAVISGDGLRALAQTLRAVHGEAVIVQADGRDTLRIELIDRRDAPLFASGRTDLTEAGHALVAEIALQLAALPHRVGVEGHTDAFPAAAGAPGNWDLSTGRANAARRILVDTGVAEVRITSVSGHAATRPLHPAEPHLSANRRVSIVLSSSE